MSLYDKYWSIVLPPILLIPSPLLKRKSFTPPPPSFMHLIPNVLPFAILTISSSLPQIELIFRHIHSPSPSFCVCHHVMSYCHTYVNQSCHYVCVILSYYYVIVSYIFIQTKYDIIWIIYIHETTNNNVINSILHLQTIIIYTNTIQYNNL